MEPILSYLTEGTLPAYSYSVTIIQNDFGLFIAKIENLDTGTVYYLGAFNTQRQAIEGVFAQINGLLSHPILQNLIPYNLDWEE